MSVNRKKLLILEDDNRVCDVLFQGLSSDYEVTTTDDTETAYQVANKDTPDVILLDIHLKAGNGIDLCHRLRQSQLTKKIPILIFTGVGTTEKMLKSFDVGADDYLEKPIDLPILRRRIQARINRIKDLSGESQVFENLRLFPERFEVELEGKTIRLSETEFELLRVFLAHPNRKITRSEILNTIWGGVQVTERTVDVHVSSLRRKLKDFNYTIKALYGSGYILRPSSRSAVI